jgi:hypothetical protein
VNGRNHWMPDADQSDKKPWMVPFVAPLADDDLKRPDGSAAEFYVLRIPRRVPSTAIRRTKSGRFQFIAVDPSSVKGVTIDIEGTVAGEPRTVAVRITPFNNKLNLFFPNIDEEAIFDLPKKKEAAPELDLDPDPGDVEPDESEPLGEAP